MIEHREPPHWVSARAKCNLDLAFAALFEIIERDISEAQNVLGERLQGYSFEIEQNGEGVKHRIRVSRKPPARSYGFSEKSVTFEKSADSISVTGDLPEPFEVVPEWDAQSASCKLRINRESHEAWQISQRALEALIFDISP